MKLKATILFVLLISVTSSIFSETMDVKIENARVDGANFKFDVMVERTDSWGGSFDGIGNFDFYWAYNASAFTGSPSLIDQNVGITSKSANYTAFLVQINGGKLQVKIEYTLTPPFDVYYPAQDTYVKICTVVWEIADTEENSAITWDQVNSGFADAEGHSITVGNWEGDGDISLPVTMSDFSADVSAETGITINWRTESETNTAGFNILRSESINGTYTKINNTLIPGQGNSSSAYDYSYSDRDIHAGVEYWYKIEEISTMNSSSFHGPIRVMGVNTIPDEFELSQNYPNPFNPETTFKYLVAEDGEVNISVYNLLGKEIKQLVSGNKAAGYYSAIWNGQDMRGMNVSSGIYFIRMQAKSFSMVRKVSLMR